MLNIYRRLMTNTTSFVAAASCCAIFFSTTTHASVISSQSSAYSLSINVSALDALVNLNVMIPAGVSGTAPSPYVLTDSLLGVDVDLSAGAISTLALATLADTTLLSASASSDVDGLSGDKTTDANTTVNDLELDLINNILLLGSVETALSLGASTIYSEAEVTGDYGSLSATGNSYVEDLALNLFNLGNVDLADIGLVADTNGVINAAPNFVVVDIYGIIGLNLTLNEQSSSCTASDCNIAVNALNLSFDSVDLAAFGIDLTGTIDGSVIIGHSEAAMSATTSATAVSAPPTLWLFALLGFGLVLRVRQNKPLY